MSFISTDFMGFSTLDPDAPRYYPVAFLESTFKADRPYYREKTHSIQGVWLKNTNGNKREVQFGSFFWTNPDDDATFQDFLERATKKTVTTNATLIIHPNKFWVGRTYRDADDLLTRTRRALDVYDTMRESGNLSEPWSPWYVWA